MTILSARGPKGAVSTYFDKELKFLKIAGVSLSGDESIPYRIYSFLIILSTGFLYPLLDTYELTKLDFNEVSDVITNLAAGWAGSVKAMVLLRKRDKMRNILVKLEQKPFAADLERGGDVEEKLLQECRRFTTVQTVTYWILAFSAYVINCGYAASTRLKSSDYHDWKLTYGPYTDLNVTYSPNYEISFAYQDLNYFFMGVFFTTVDLLLAGVLAHVTYQFKILQNFFKQLVEISQKEMVEEAHAMSPSDKTGNPAKASAISWKYLQKSLARAVGYHQAIIDLVQEVEDMFSNLELSLFLTALCQLCFSIYSTSKMLDNNMMFIKNVLTGLSMCFQVLLVCYWGEQVVHESQQVGKSAYESNFVGTDVRFQKSLVLVMRRSQNPIKITAGKFAVISLATFTWFLRTSYSAFAVLRTTDSGKN